MQGAKASKRLFKMAQGIIIIAITATYLAQHHLHPGLTHATADLAEEVERLLRVVTCLPEIALFTEEHRQFIQGPPGFIALILSAMKLQAAAQVHLGLRVLPNLTQDRSQTTLYLALCRAVAQACRVNIGTAQHRQQLRHMAMPSHSPGGPHSHAHGLLQILRLARTLQMLEGGEPFFGTGLR